MMPSPNSGSRGGWSPFWLPPWGRSRGSSEIRFSPLQFAVSTRAAVALALAIHLDSGAVFENFRAVHPGHVVVGVIETRPGVPNRCDGHHGDATGGAFGMGRWWPGQADFPFLRS